ncbi:MAG: glycosyltransferase, partial [Eggerthellaceae bacterium]|nr:glycosyltransferase [Eggerthellaceae bacterium]
MTESERKEILEGKGVALLVPCYNEELTVAKVVDDFKKQLPKADIYVYDNNSKDDTAKVAVEHGAIVKRETLQGKGRVVRSMLRDVKANYFIMVDGDDTYPAEYAQALLEPLLDGTADMCVGDRISNGTYGKENERKFHCFGNNLVRFLIKLIYKFEFHDVM